MNITLIGMPGVGKSFLGKKLAEKLNYKFLDIDELIEKNAGLKLQKIIDDFGDDEFLKIEERTILELGKINNCVIAPGGSMIYCSGAMNLLKRNSVVVFLDTSYKNIEKRLENRTSRGIVGLKKNGLKKLYNERLIMYKKYADITIKLSENRNINIIIDDIIQQIKNLEK